MSDIPATSSSVSSLFDEPSLSSPGSSGPGIPSLSIVSGLDAESDGLSASVPPVIPGISGDGPGIKEEFSLPVGLSATTAVPAKTITESTNSKKRLI